MKNSAVVKLIVLLFFFGAIAMFVGYRMGLFKSSQISYSNENSEQPVKINSADVEKDTDGRVLEFDPKLQVIFGPKSAPVFQPADEAAISDLPVIGSKELPNKKPALNLPSSKKISVFTIEDVESNEEK